MWSCTGGTFLTEKLDKDNECDDKHLMICWVFRFFGTSRDFNPVIRIGVMLQSNYLLTFILQVFSVVYIGSYIKVLM